MAFQDTVIFILVTLCCLLNTNCSISQHSSNTSRIIIAPLVRVVNEYLIRKPHDNETISEFSGNNNFVSEELEANDIYDHSYIDHLKTEIVLKQLDKELQDKKKARLKKLFFQSLTVPEFNSQFQGCSNDPYPTPDTRKIKLFQINLDDKPENRWKEVLIHKRHEIKKLADFFEFKFGSKFMSVVDKLISYLYLTLPEEYFMELKGISDWTGISIGRVTLYNVFYELFSLCTSIVIEGENGQMYHGRNLDFGLFMGWDARNHSWFLTEILRPMIIQVEFLKNGKTLYSAASYAAYTGILTGVKKGIFSLTINERFIKDGGYVGLAEWILGRRDISWLGFLTRQVMESATSYQQAQHVVATTRLVAPAYFTMAGNSSGQGCVITRGRNDSDIWNLGSRHTNQSGNWYLLETNYDHWKQTPFFDHRRRYAVQCMDQLGRKKPMDTLYRVLSTKPVLNKETTLTALMDVSAGLIEVWERDCPDPCWPF